MAGPEKPRIPALDGVRGVAILLVLIWHYGQNQLRGEPGTAVAALKQVLGFTWSGVDLFFVLSGFLIAGILIDQRQSPRYFQTFYIRRACRIFPIYYLNVLVFFGLALLAVGETGPLDRLFMSADVPFWSYATYTQNIYMGLHGAGTGGWLAVTWSLAIEEQFYLLLPFLIRFAPYRWLPYLLAWFILSAVTLRFAYPGLSAYINTPWRADALLLGALIAWALRDDAIQDWLRSTRTWLGTVAAAMAVGVVAAAWGGRLVLGGPITHFVLALLYAGVILVLLLSPRGVMDRMLSVRWLRWLGTISYAVFLVHVPISALVHYWIRGQFPSIASWADAAVTATALVLTLIVAQASYWLIERRMIALGHGAKY